MRLATLILGLVLGLVLWVLLFVTQVADHTALETDGATDLSAATFWLLPLCWLIGVAFVMAWPLVSTLAFGGAAVLAVYAALQVETASTYGGMMVLWALVSLALAGLAFFGWIGKRLAR